MWGSPQGQADDPSRRGPESARASSAERKVWAVTRAPTVSDVPNEGRDRVPFHAPREDTPLSMIHRATAISVLAVG
jgi:hypothetical protein